MVTFTEEIVNGKLHFLGSKSFREYFSKHDLTSNRCFYIFELKVRDTKFKTIPESIWWTINTITTVGYGDMTPSSTKGKIFGAFCSTCSILILALPVSVIGNILY